MSDHTVAGLRAALKALKEVITPAVDSSNPLAVEQLRMVCGFLSMVCDQLPYRAQRIRFDLQSAIQLAEALASTEGVAENDASDAQAKALTHAMLLQQAPDATEAEMCHATAQLAAATTAFVRASADADETVRRQVDRAVLAGSKTWLDVQRAWFEPLGFDSEARSLPPLAQALTPPIRATQTERATA